MLSDYINSRKIGIMFLVFTLVFTGMGLSFGTSVSYAAEEGTNLEIYVSDLSSGGDNTTGDGTREKPYATLKRAFDQIKAGETGTIYLLNDITLSGAAKETIDLTVDKRVTVTTASGVERVTIKCGQPVSGTNNALFGLTDGELTLRNIILDGNFNDQPINGRLINVFGYSKLIIEEGAILQNSYSNFPGSAIHVNGADSVVEMTGGEIKGNKRDSTGAAVLVDAGQFNMSGGLITGNTGGGVQSRGGGVSLSGEARITGNTIGESELNVYLEKTYLLNLSGDFTGEAGITAENRMAAGKQFGQATAGNLEGIENHLIADSGSLLASYDANKNLVWRAFKNDLSKPSTDGEVMGKKPTLTGVTEPFANVKIEIVSAADQSVIVSEEVTADENGNWEFPVANALTIGAYTINVTANKNNTQSGTVTRQFEVSSDVYVSSGGSDTTGDGTQNNPYATLYKAYQEVVDGGTIYVMDNIDLSVNAAKKYLHLDQPKSVTISTASGADTAVIQRGSAKGAATGELGGDRDTLIHLEKGQLTLKNIIIDATLGNVYFNGRIMNVYKDSKLIIEEGAVLRNSPSAFGGTAIYLDGDGNELVASIEMKGGEITGNKHSTSNAAAVLIVDNARFTMTGGKITDNSGGGVDLSTNTNTQFVLSGTAQITGNSGSSQPERNVILQGNTLLTLNDDFTGEAGITAHNRMTAGANFGVAARDGLQGLGNLFADNGHLLGSYAEGTNNLVWRSFKNELTQPSTNGETTGTNPTLKGVTEPFAKVKIKIVSATDPSIVIIEEERTADASGNWELAIDDALNKGEYTINVTADNNKTQSEPVTRTFEVVDLVVDKTKLQAKHTGIEEENLVETEYTEASWLALQEAMTNAAEVLGSETATQEEVDTALAALEKARSELTKKPAAVDKTILQGKYDEITAENLPKESYTTASWQALEDALKAAESVLDNPAATQEEVDTALAALEKARSELTKKPAAVDKTILQGKYDEITAENLPKESYTTASWQALEDALKAAESVLDDPAATQEAVDRALADLQQAENNLVKINGELDQLNLVGLATGGEKGIALNPGFEPDQFINYKGTVTNDIYGIGLNPAAKHPADTELKVIVNGKEYSADQWSNLPLDEGKNEIIIGVYTKDGKVINEYSIEIVREPAATAGGKLESLVPSVGSLSPAFDPDHTSYAMSVTNSVYQLQLTPTAIDPEATIAIRVNNGEWKEVASGSISDYLALNVGTNTIDIKVTDKNGAVKEYGVTVTRDSGNSGNNGGNGSSGGSGGGTTSPTTPSTPSTPSTPANDLDVTLNGSSNPFATGTTSTSDGRTTTSVKIELDKLAAAISEGKGQDLSVHSPKAGDMAVEGLTADTLKQLNDKGASLKVSNLLAIYPVPASNVNLSGVAGQLGNAALNDIAVHIDIKRSSEDLISSAKSKAADAGYELLVDPVDLDLTFSHDGQTVRSGQLDGYAVKYIALPEGIDPNRITTGVIINPDGSVYHVPTVVTEMNNRYFARINDLRSSGSYSVIWNPQDFADVQSHWGKKDVNNIAARLDLKGNGDNTFSPDRSVTRSEFAEIVVLGLGLMRSDAPNANFPDVSSNAWYGNAVAIANEFDIVRGYDNGNFNGGQQITREQGFAMIARAYRLIQSEGLPGQEQIASTLAKYEDGASVAAWAKADIAQLIAAGIIQGNGPELLSPKTQMTRAEVTALMARMLKATNLIDK